jgi:hypothetical protein
LSVGAAAVAKAGTDAGSGPRKRGAENFVARLDQRGPHCLG